ncbi:MAG TPA: threonine-phosphate decarboxylase CobD [Acetobacteraceae bacterium]
MAEAASANTMVGNMGAGWMAGPDMPHGGMVSAMRRRFPGAPEPFLDLSTGINPVPYPMPDLPADCLTRLPDAAAMAELQRVAARAYGVADTAMVVAAPGTQILIGLLPFLLPRVASVAIVSPTYGEHRAAWTHAGYDPAEIGGLAERGVAACVVLCNPNNPDGLRHDPAVLVRLADALGARGGMLVVDEAFADLEEPGLSLAPFLPHPSVVVLRSFGKTYGLAGVRLGFALAAPGLADRLRRALGPWAVSGGAIAVGSAALADAGWRWAAVARLDRDIAALDGIAGRAGLALVGGTRLFRLYAGEAAADVHERLGRQGIMTRRFMGQPRWLRLGLPGTAAAWERLRAAI